jgi:uncharacterized membrane protein
MTDTTAETSPLAEAPRIRPVGPGAVSAALRAGWADFMARPTHIPFLFLVYPVIGVLITFVAFDYNLMPMVFPLIAGFALVGPITAVGVFELSRRRERGEAPRLADALAIFRHPSAGAMLRVALLLFLLFVVWLVVAQQVVFATIGRETPAGLGAFVETVLTTEAGWTMFLVGNGLGFLFAVAALAVSVVSLPMLVDGETSATRAVATSLRAVARNPVTMAAWGLAVAAILAISMLPAFAGLIVALPWLGHATWHLYRAVVERPA